MIGNTGPVIAGPGVSPVAGKSTGTIAVGVSVGVGRTIGVLVGCGLEGGGAEVLAGTGVLVGVGVLIGVGVSVGVGAATTYGIDTGAEGHPNLSVITSVTVYVPAAPYTLEGVGSVLVVLSPKSQA